jgi:nucleotide-binding universal stress UspA family protein
MTPTPSKILVSTDFSKASEHAVDYALGLARKLGAEVILLHAYELPMVGFPDGTLLATAEMANQIITSAQSLLDKMVVSRSDCGVRLTPLLRNGDPRDEILATAKRAGADLIVMGTHGRRGLARALLGSVAEAVVRTAECPVLTVRSAD